MTGHGGLDYLDQTGAYSGRGSFSLDMNEISIQFDIMVLGWSLIYFEFVTSHIISYHNQIFD